MELWSCSVLFVVEISSFRSSRLFAPKRFASPVFPPLRTACVIRVLAMEGYALAGTSQQSEQGVKLEE